MPRYNPAPGWPAGPEGWLPPRGWQPDTGWTPAPDGWPLVVPGEGELGVEPTGRQQRAWAEQAGSRWEVVSVAPSYGRPDPVTTGSRRPLSRLGRAALVLGVLSVVAWPVGLVVSVFALVRIDPARERGRAWAVAGLVITVVLWGIVHVGHGSPGS